MAKPALGRGLGALLGGSPIAKPLPMAPSVQIPESPLPGSNDRVHSVSLTRIQPCPFQPRKDFPADTLQELADSIREQGIVQPLIVRERSGHFELIAGERRWRAAQLVGLTEVPVIVREADDRAVLELALIENLQRENLNPIEEAQGYAKLNQQFQLTQDEIAKKVGKSRAVVANSLRLLNLAPEIQGFLRDGRLSVGHAKVILSLEKQEQQTLVAERVIKEGLNVRQTEGLTARWQSADRTAAKATRKTLTQGAQITHLEDQLRERLGTRVRLRYSNGKGALEISFFSDAELERVLQVLGVAAG